MDSANEAAVELEEVGGHLRQLQETCLAGAEIVVDQEHLELCELVSQPLDCRRVGHRAFMDLQGQT